MDLKAMISRFLSSPAPAIIPSHLPLMDLPQAVHPIQLPLPQKGH
jgi:hypothetical protein